MNSRTVHQRRAGGRSVAQPQRADPVFNDPSLWQTSFPAVQQQQPAQSYTPVQIPQHQHQTSLTSSLPASQVPAASYNVSNEWMSSYFPDSEMSPTDTDALMSPMSDAAFLPTYGSTEVQGPTFSDFKQFAVPEDDLLPAAPQFNPFLDHSSDAQSAAQVPLVTVDPLQLTNGEKDSQSGQHGLPKQRSAHRKAIEEKSSVKRKKAEHRLVTAISSRLGGTFVPGLANQLNQAAELLEKDQVTIKRQEEEIRQLQERLRGYQHYSDMKVPIYK